MQENLLKSSSDVWFIAFLMSKNYVVKDYQVIGKGRVKCFFDISEDEWRKLKLEFNSSDLIKFKTIIEQIKDMAY